MSEDVGETIALTIPFFPKLNTSPRYKRVPRAIRLLKEFVKKHTKAEDIIITQELNEFMWKRGIENPPRKVDVTALVEILDDVRVATVDVVIEKVKIETRPELKSIEVPGELEEEEEEEEEEPDITADTETETVEANEGSSS